MSRGAAHTARDTVAFTGPLPASDPLPPDLITVEQQALALPPGQAVAVLGEALDALLASPQYRPSLGHPGYAVHFRRGLPDGSGFHLVLLDGRAELHRDLFDPHAGPAAMALHLATDAPAYATGVLAAGWAVLRRLGR
jgi:hypothetical protein